MNTLTKSAAKLAAVIALLTSAACTHHRPTASALKPIRIAYPAEGTIVSAQVGLVLQRTDILKKHGFAGTVTPMGTGREMKTALVSGQVDIIMTSESNFVVLLGKGFAAEAINTLGSAGRVALVVPAKSKYKKLSDLKGKTIATIFGTSLHQPAVKWAKEAGGANVINISQSGALRSALETGGVDAIIDWDPFLVDPLKERKIRVIKQSTFNLITVTSSAFAKAHPNELARFQSAFKDAVWYMDQNKKQVNGWWADMSKLSVDTIDEACQNNGNYTAKSKANIDLSISDAYRSKLMSLAQFLHDAKLIQTDPDIQSHILGEGIK